MSPWRWMVANGNGGSWMINAILTIILAALSAFGGMKAGLASGEVRDVSMQEQIRELKQDFTQRQNRLEDKIDWLIAREAGRK